MIRRAAAFALLIGLALGVSGCDKCGDWVKLGSSACSGTAKPN